MQGKQQTADHDGFHTNSADDLYNLLKRAEKFADEALGFDGMAAEFGEAAEYVDDEILDNHE